MPIRIVHELRKVRGRNAKLSILRKHKDNTLWKNVLVAMYDSSVNYYVSAPSDMTFVENDCAGMFSILFTLSSRAVTGNNARALAIKGSKAYGEIFRLILKGSVNAGISVKTINKAYPCLIPTFDVMLAEKCKPTKFPVYASIKYDGVRVVVLKRFGDIQIRTRSGKQLYISSLTKSFEQQPDGVYDGELVMGDGLQVTRTGITGAVNKVLTGTMDDIEGYTFCIFDKLTNREWDNHTCVRSLSCRLSDLNENLIPDIYLRTVTQKPVNSHKEIADLFASVHERGYEGLILRYMDDAYEWRRTKALMKVKKTATAELTCVDVIDGHGKYENMIGAIHCIGTIKGKYLIDVKVGTGLSDYARDMPHDFYVGYAIEVEYNDIIKAKNNDTYSLFLPVFKRVVGGHI